VHISQHKLRRLRSRATRVVQRYGELPQIAAFQHTLVPIAERHHAVGNQVTASTAHVHSLMQVGREHVGVLYGAMHGWLAQVGRDLEDFDTRTFVARPDVPDDVINDGERLLSLVRQLPDDALPYGGALISTLGAQLEAARTAWAGAQDALSEQQALKAELRTASEALNAELKALRPIIGTSSRDYQKLRTARASQRDEEDDEPLSDTSTATTETGENGVAAGIPADGVPSA
jgi:hypothetical protein